ncbi:hypothetical protein [Vibrio parahaemolyticus]|uniref:hypothetical protein n=1 Tax=Vibrio parahaemolyticus TaxID=670 RepID=UPI002111D8AB|nr:hypothetical protein [Vibrio parahaemolyticus]
MKHVMSRMVSSLSNNDYVDMSGNNDYVDMGSLVKAVNQSSSTHPQLKNLSVEERQDLFKLLNACANYNKTAKESSINTPKFPLSL